MTNTLSSEPKRFRGSTTTYVIIGVVIIVVVAILLYFVPVPVSGAVSDAGSGQPLADVTVALSNGEQATSDADGRFSFRSSRLQPVTASIDESIFEPWQDNPQFAPVPLLGGKLTASLQPTEVSGLVVDALTGDPVSGVTASFEGQQATTDAEGRFELSHLPRSGATVTLSADGFIERTIALDAIGDDAANLTVYPDGLHGLVLDAASGTPVAGAALSLNDASSESADDGFYYFPSSTGMGQLTVQAAGFLPAAVDVIDDAALAGEQAMDIAVEPTVLTGTVLDGKTGEPVAGASIQAGGQTATTDEDGNYRLERLSTGDLSITASHSDYETLDVTADEAANLLAGEPLDMTLLPPHLAGSVVNNVTNGPIVGATVAAGTLSAVTDDQGQFILWTTDTPLDVTIDAVGYETAEDRFNEDTPLTVALEPKGLVVKVSDSAGQPVSSAAVTSPRSEATTDEQGVALLPLLEAGDLFTVTLAGFAPATQTYQGEAQVDLALAADTAAGAVVDAVTGEPVPGAIVYVYDKNTCQGIACRGTEPVVMQDAEADGTFEVSGMPANAQVMVKAPGYSLLFPDALAAGDCGAPYCLQAEMQPFEARGFYVPFHYLYDRGLINSRLDLIEQSDVLNAVVVDMKSDYGEIAWEPKNEIAREIGVFQEDVMTAQEFLEEARQRGIYTIARFVTFKDNALAEGKPEWALAKRSNPGVLWKDGEDLAWVDPYRDEVRQYEIDLAKELAEIGFDEVQFDYFRFTGQRDHNALTYSVESTPENRREAISSFSRDLMAALKPYGAFTAIDVFGSIILNGNEPLIGQNLADMAQGLDYLSPMIYPQVWWPGTFPGCDEPVQCPYKVIYDSTDIVRDIVPMPTRIRPWLQGYPNNYRTDGPAAGYNYAVPEMMIQRRAADDAGAEGWLFWSGGGNFPDEIFGPLPSLAELEAQVQARQGGRSGPY
ncbi:MAG: carboxypeptidase regulatory-like domain-containing protein [Anaerolineae bacterium]|nr:carboxypeptidase regulatory-like domain-containing protein [Anaerolineae bacterium]